MTEGAKKNGNLLIFSGPSGVGKDTAISKLMEDKNIPFAKSISYTTRSMRPNEVAGESYNFVSLDEFKQLRKKKKFLEWARYDQEYYATSKDFVEKALKEGKNVLLVIDAVGSKKIVKRFSNEFNIVTFFMYLDDMEMLKRRLSERNLNSSSSIKRRLSIAKRELKSKDQYNYIIKMDDIETEVESIKKIITSKIIG
ncbi:MAG: guanylate kinase [Mycoplasmoidaceae bacterium]|nr:MAG: guanylate kinase [Mycoplasmoidaceae bacterium]